MILNNSHFYLQTLINMQMGLGSFYLQMLIRAFLKWQHFYLKKKRYLFHFRFLELLYYLLLFLLARKILDQVPYLRIYFKMLFLQFNLQNHFHNPFSKLNCLCRQQKKLYFNPFLHITLGLVHHNLYYRKIYLQMYQMLLHCHFSLKLFHILKGQILKLTYYELIK